MADPLEEITTSTGGPGNFTETAPPDSTPTPTDYYQSTGPFEGMKDLIDSGANERARLHATQSLGLTGAMRSSGAKTIADLPTPPEGTPQEVINFAAGRPFVYGGKMYAVQDTVEASRKTLEDIQADSIAYKMMPPAQGFAQNASAVIGTFAGGMTTPENYVIAPIRVGTAAWRAGRPLLSSIIDAGLGQGVIQTVTDPLVQAGEIYAGTRKEYDPVQTSLALPTGFALGAFLKGFERGAGVLYRASVDTWAGKLTQRMDDIVAKEARLTDLNPELRPNVDPAPDVIPSRGMQGERMPEAPAPVRTINPAEPPVQPGYVRLYRQDAPGVDRTKPENRVEFTTDATRARETPSWGASDASRTELRYLDVPEQVAAAGRSGDRVNLPGDVAAQRQAMPEPPAEKPGAGATGETAPSVEPRPQTVAAEAASPKVETPEAAALRQRADEMQASASNEKTTAKAAQKLSKDADGLRVLANKIENRSSLQDDSSWVIRNKETKEVVMETFDKKKVAALNTKKYEAVPIQEYLGEINRAALGRTRAMAEQPGSAAPHGPVTTAAVPSNLPAEQLPYVQRLGDVMREIADRLNMTVRKGMVGKGNVASFDPADFVTRLSSNTANSFRDFSHELGHFVHETVGGDLNKLIQARAQTMRAFGGQAVDHLKGADMTREGFSEFMAGYITNRRATELRDPAFFRDFRDTMQRDAPELLRALDDANVAWERYQAAPSRAVGTVGASLTAMPEEPYRDPLNRSKLSLWLSNVYTQIVNRQHPMSIMVRAMAESYERQYGKLLDLPPDQDPVKLLQIFGGRGGHQMAVMDLTYGVQDAHSLKPSGPSFFQILREVAADPTGQETKDGVAAAARMKAFDQYLVDRWDRTLRDQMKNGERPEMTRNPTSATDGQIALRIAETEKLYPHFTKLADQIYDFNKELLKKRRDAHFLTPEEFNEYMHPKNREYVPLRRDMRGITEGTGTPGQGMANLERVKDLQRRGSDRDVLPPTESIILQAFATNDQLTQNWMVLAIRDLARLIKTDGGRFAEEIPNTVLRRMDIDVEEAVKNSALKNGWLAADAKDFAQDVMMNLGPENRVQLYRSEALKAGSRPIIFGWENGERFALQLPDGEFGRQVQEVMDGIGPQGVKSWAQASGLITNMLFASSSTLRAGATGTITYQVKNLVRDAFMQYLLLPEASTLGQLTLANAVKGGKSFVTGDNFYRLHNSLGGIRGGVAAESIGDSKRVADVLQQAGVKPHQMVTAADLKTVLSWMEISEGAGRIGAFRAIYEANIAMGRSERYAMFDAAHKARDFIDYGRHGSTMETVARIVPFLNSNFQGVDKFMRTYAGSPTNPGIFFKPYTEQQAARQAELRQALVPRVAALAAVSAALTYAYQDDPVYSRINNQMRSQYWIFRLPFIKPGIYDLAGGGKVELPEGMQGAWITVPKPWEPATIFNLAERAVEFGHTGDPDAVNSFMKSLRYTFSIPNPFENVITNVGQGLSANYNQFFQTPIVPENLQKVAPHLQANEYTNKFYVAVAQGLNKVWKSEDARKWFRENMGGVGAALGAFWSPMEMAYLMQGVFGDWPRELGGVGGVTRSLITGDPMKMNDVPGLRAFVRDQMGQGEPMRELYNQVGQNSGRLTVALNTYKKLVDDGDIPQAQSYFSQMDKQQREYALLQTMDAGADAHALHPMERSKNLSAVVRAIKNGLVAEGGLATLNDKTARIKLEPGMRDVAAQILNEISAIEARNSLIVQGVSGYRGIPAVDTAPYLDALTKISPQLAQEFSARLAEKKVVPIETVQQFWPEMQRALRVGGDARELSSTLKSIAGDAAAQGYFGGGMKSGRGAVDSGGFRVKRGKPVYPEPVGGAQ